MLIARHEASKMSTRSLVLKLVLSAFDFFIYSPSLPFVRTLAPNTKSTPIAIHV